MDLPDLHAADAGGNASGGRRKRARTHQTRGAWAPGANAPSIRTGGGGLGTQAQHLLSNLTHNLTPHRVEIAKLFKKRPQITITALVASLCGIAPATVRLLIRRVDEGGQQAVRAPLVRAGPGRKRLHDPDPTTSSDEELPDLGEYDLFGDADGDSSGAGDARGYSATEGLSSVVPAMSLPLASLAAARHTPAEDGQFFASQAVP